jgi:hypothetical protein
MNEQTIPSEIEVGDKKRQIKSLFISELNELNLVGVTFGGFYSSDNESRASSLGFQISFNERFLKTTPLEEYDRLNSHELQHMKWKNNFTGIQESRNMWLFVFHPIFVDLHSRMNTHFEGKASEGYVFGKKVKELPQKYDDLETPSSNYCHPDEILALLSGYKKYTKQCRLQKRILPTKGYEFIEAFKPEDLQLLDDNYRSQIGEDVLLTNPSIIHVNDTDEEPLKL